VVDIWNDPWLPTDHTRRPVTPRGRNLIRRVAELINPISEDWDTQLVLDTFREEDAKVILALPLNISTGEALAWHYDHKGVFWVRSAYKIY